MEHGLACAPLRGRDLHGSTLGVNVIPASRRSTVDEPTVRNGKRLSPADSHRVDEDSSPPAAPLVPALSRATPRIHRPGARR